MFIRSIAIAICVVCTQFTTNAHSALVEMKLFAPGDKLVTLDTKTRLEWLDVNATVNVFVTDVLNPATTFSTLNGLNPVYDLGFRYASSADVQTLFFDAGIPEIYPNDNLVGYSQANYAPVLALMSKLGVTGFLSESGMFASVGDPNFTWGWTGDGPESGFFFKPLIQVCTASSSTVSCTGNNEGPFQVGRAFVPGGYSDRAESLVGNFLVRDSPSQPSPVPLLPSTLPSFATGLGILGLLGWRRKRKSAHPQPD